MFTPQTKMLPWTKMIGLYPACHLVTAVYRHDGKTYRLKLLQRHIETLPPSGAWAARTSSDRGEDIVQAAFEKEADALRLGESVGARRAETYAGWASQRVFGFTAEVAKRIEQRSTLRQDDFQTTYRPEIRGLREQAAVRYVTAPCLGNPPLSAARPSPTS